MASFETNSKDAFEVPNGYSLGFVSGPGYLGQLNVGVDPYSETVQSTNLRNIQSVIEPKYIAKNDTLELDTSWNVTPNLTFYSDTGYNHDFLWSTEGYNRFDTSPGIFHYVNIANPAFMTLDPNFPPNLDAFPPYGGGAILCDPQLGCTNRLVVQDLSTEQAWQLSQEFRLASSLRGPVNFRVGGDYMHYQTTEKYYVFSNGFTLFSAGGASARYIPGVTDNLDVFTNGRDYIPPPFQSGLQGRRY